MGPSELRKRHWAWGGGLVLVASLTLAACGTPSSTMTTGDTADGTAATTLAVAVEATLAEPTGRASVQVDFDLPATAEAEGMGAPIELRLDGRYDTGAGRSEMTGFVRFPPLPTPPATADIPIGPATEAYLWSLSESIFSPEGTTSRAVIDLGSGTIYREAPAGIVPGGRAGWVSLPIGEWRTPAVLDPRRLDELDTGRAFLAYLRAATEVQSRADGDRTRYDGVVRTVDLPEPRPVS